MLNLESYKVSHLNLNLIFYKGEKIWAWSRLGST